MAWNEIIRGLKRVANGVQTVMRADMTGAGVVTAAHGYYAEPSQNASLMTVSTAVAGVAPGTALSTTPPMAIWNPPSSGYNLSILKTSIGLVSGTLGGGSILYAQYIAQTTVPSTGTELVPVNAMLGFPRGVGRSFQGSTLAGTPTILRAGYTMGALVNTTPVAATPTFDLVDGEFTVAPGTVFVIQGLAAAGTSPLVVIGVTWEEIPLV